MNVFAITITQSVFNSRKMRPEAGEIDIYDKNGKLICTSLAEDQIKDDVSASLNVNKDTVNIHYIDDLGEIGS